MKRSSGVMLTSPGILFSPTPILSKEEKDPKTQDFKWQRILTAEEKLLPFRNHHTNDILLATG